MGVLTWKQASADYEKKSAGSNTAGTTPPTSGMLSWKQAADEFDRYDEDGYKALGMQRVADREREYNARYSGLTVNTDPGFDEDTERNINAWINRYNQTMNELRGGTNGKWFSKDAIDRYSRDVDSLVSQYDSIKDYASVYGFENSLSHYGKLREIQDAIKQQTGWHEKYNGKGHEDIEQILSGMEASDERDWLEASRYDVYKTAPDYQQRSQTGLAAFENSKPKDQEEESWFEAIGRYLGKASDTTMALGDTGRMAQEYRKDTTYREPADNWTDDQRSTYGYLYSINPEAASDFAVKTSEGYRQAENQQKLGAIQEWATKNGVNASAGTVAAIAMMPLSLADTLNALTEYNARGTISTPSSPTPSQVSEAITGAVGQSLNEKHGTISSKIPVIGGKGWGDAYQLGTSIANSLLSAYTQGSIGTDILFFGSAASSSMYNAKDRGATDEQAIKLGVLSGLAEAAGEHFSIEGLIGMSEADTMKAFFGNVLKQSGIEASEEGFTTLMNNFADQLIMGKDSSYYQKVRSYMSENGMGEKEAKKLAWIDMAEDLAFDMVGGAISGGFSTGIQTGAQKIFGGTQQAQTHHEPLATDKDSLTTELANSEDATVAKNATTEESSAVDYQMSATEESAENAHSTNAAPTLETLSEKYGDRAADMRKTFMEGQDVQEYDRAFRMAYDMGKAGVNESYAQRSEATAYLSETQRSIAYNMGAMDAQAAAGAQAAKNAAAANGKTGWHKGTVKGQGVKIADMAKAFNDPQRKAYKYLSNIAEVTGVDIVLYKSETDADGNYQGAQGKFKWNENTIYIDINAGLDHYANADQLAKYTMMRTFDHEFMHFIEKWNPEEYNSFRSLIFETMESNGTNVEDVIELMMEKTGNALTYDQASREVIAEAMTDILPETSFIEQLARKNQNVFQQLLSKLKEFLTSLKSHFAAMGDSTKEAKALKKQMGETVSYMEDIVKRFDEISVKAVENYQRTVAEDATVSKEEKVVAKTETTTEAKPAETVTEDTVSETEDSVSETEDSVIESSKVVSEVGKVASEDASLDASPAPAAKEYRSEHGYTIRSNEQYGSLEITFDSKPSQEVRDALRANKYRWNGKKGVWYGKTNQQTIVDALDKAYQPKTADPVDLSQKPMERTGDTVTIGDPAKATHEVEVTLSDEEYEALMQAVPEKQEATEPVPATEAAQEVPPKAETEEAKKELRKAVRMPIQGTNAEALLQGIKSKELSMESITLSGSVDGFNDQQRHHLVTKLLEGVYTDSEVIKIDVPYDGKFEIINTPGNVAKVLENLKVRVNQEAMFDKKTISLLTSNGDVRIVELDGQKYLSNSYVMIPSTDAGVEYIKAEFNGKEMTLHPPVEEAFQRADKPLKEAPTEAKLGKTNVLIFREDGKQLYFDKRYFAPLDGGQLFYAEINGAGILKSVDASGNVLGYLMGIKPGKDSKITNEKPSNLKSYQKKKGTGITAPKSAEKTTPVATEAAAPVPEEKPDTQKKAVAKAAKPATVETSVKLEDFGEKIGGARKDQWSKRGLLADDLTDMNDRERDKNVKKDNVWKRPDYRKLIEGGADRNILFVRNEIRKALNQNIAYPYRATEDQRLWIQQEFIETVREIQAMAEKVSTKEDLLAMGRPWLKAKGYIQESGTSYTEKWRKNPALLGTDYVYTIEHLARNFDNLTKLADKANFAVDAEKKIPNGFSIHEDDSNHTWFITRGSWIVKHSFPSYDDALNYLRNAASNSKKKTRFVPQQLLEVHRKGPDYRSSKDVKGQDYLDTFGFKGGEFGNWMSEKDRRVSMNYGFDALKDLADALGIADTDISLGGNLSIAFGARGQGLSGAAAHYEQERHVINLTKMNGAGSLAHEWFHALDDFLGGYGSKFATEYGAKLPEATKAAVRHLLTTMQYRDATQEETDMAATKSYEQARRSVTYQVSNQFGWVQKVENGTFQDHDAKYYARKPTAADTARYHALLDKLLETGDAAIVDELSALRKEVTGHVIPKEDRDSIGFRLSALRPDATKNIQKMRLRSDFYNGSRRFGELHHKDGDYWDSTIEMAARAFACYVADKTGKHNDYLSAHSDTAATLDVDKNGNVSVVRAYPTGQERVQINVAFDQLFAALKEDGFLHQQGEVTKPDIIQYQRRPGEVRRFSYEWFTSKPDMAITEVERVGKVNTRELRSQIIEKAMENAKSVGTVNELGNPVVHVKDTGTDVVISKTGIRHSMDRRADVVGSVAVKIGDILSNAVLMNELNPRSENITDSYILIGAAKNKTNEPYIVSFVVNRYTSEVTDIDVLYAVNAKTEPAGSLSPSITAETAGYFTGSTVTISNLLDFVNQYFPDTMPEDVLKHYGHDRRPDGTLGQDALYQQRYGTLTDRDILDLAANDLSTEDMTEAERGALEIFRDRLAKLDDLQEQRAQLGRTYKDQQFGQNVNREAAALTLEKMHVLDERIKEANSKVLDVEEKTVLRDVLKKARKVVEQAQKDHDQEILKRWRDRRNNAASIKKYQQRIAKDVKALSDWVIHPDNKDVVKHVPDVLKNAVIPFLTGIDFTSKRQLRGGSATKADAEFVKRLEKLQAALKINIDETGLYSGYNDLPPQFMEKLQGFINAVKNLTAANSGEFVVNRMTSDELKALSEIVGTLKKLIQDCNKFHYNSMYHHVWEAGDATIDSLSQYKDAKSRSKTGETVDNFLFWQQIRPAYAWERFGQGGKAIYDGLRRGQARLAFNTKRIIDFSEKTYSAEEVLAWEKEVKDIGLDDGSVIRVKTAQAMSFYELSKDKDALRHILGQGIRVATYHAGKEKISDTGHLMSIEDVNAVIDSLTDRQKEVADQLQQFMATQGAKWGNFVSVKRFGEELFSNPTYFPINSDGRHLQANTDEMPENASLYALLNMGFTKSRNENANNRIVLYSIFDVFANHMASMAQYNALSLPVLDALKWFNYQQKEDVTVTENGEETVKHTVKDSVRDELNRVYGVAEETRPGSGRRGYAENFITGILKAFNGTEAQGIPTDETGLSMRQRYNMAQVAFNLRVVAQQPLAITRAGMLIPYRSIIRGMKLQPAVIQKNIAEMQRYSGIAAWKELGFYDINISRGLTDLIKHKETWRDKVNEKGMKWAEKADRLTWAGIWSACKEEVVRRGTKPSDKGFFDAVSQLFEDVIYKTQVVDSVLTKNEYMRSKGFWARTTSSFMSEPVTNASMLIDAYDKLQMDMQKGMDFSQAWRRNKANIGRTAYVYGMGAAVLAAVTAVMDALRDDDEYETFLEKWSEAFSGNLIDELNPLGKLPLVKEVSEFVKELAAAGWKMDVYGQMSNLPYIDMAEQFIKGVEILSDKINAVDTNYTLYGGAYKLLQAVSGIFGLPMAAFTREVITIWNNTVGRMAPSYKVKTYDAGEKSNIKYAYQDGYLTEEEAMQELLDKGLSDNEDEAYWLIRKWDSGTDSFSRYDAIDEAVRSGNSINTEMGELTSHGYTEEDVRSHIKTSIGKWYQEGTITKQQAMDMLKKYSSLNRNEITEIVNRWSSKVVTGIAFDDIKEQFMSGDLSQSKAAEMYVRYGGYTKEKAAETVSVWAFVKKYPECDGITSHAVADYTAYCEKAGVPAKTFYQAWKHKNTLSGTVKAPMMEYINGLNLSRSQKDSLYYAFGWAESTINEAPWH